MTTKKLLSIYPILSVILILSQLEKATLMNNLKQDTHTHAQTHTQRKDLKRQTNLFARTLGQS